MRYPASEKLEIIRLVEQSHQPVKKTLEQIGVSRPRQSIDRPIQAVRHPYQQEQPVQSEKRSPKRAVGSAVGTRMEHPDGWKNQTDVHGELA